MMILLGGFRGAQSLPELKIFFLVSPQVLDHNMQLLSRNSQLVEENASVLSRMVALHQRQMQASTGRAGPKPAAAPAPQPKVPAKPARRGVLGKLLGRSKSPAPNLPRWDHPSPIA